MKRSWAATYRFAWFAFSMTLPFMTVAILGCNYNTEPEPFIAFETEEDRQSIESRIDRLIRMNDVAGASQSLRHVLAANPDDFWALERLGDVSIISQDFAIAADLYRDSIQKNLNANETLYRKWHQSLLKCGLPYEAIAALQQFRLKYPDLEDVNYDLAGLSVAMGVPRIALPAIRWLIIHGHADFDTLMLMLDPDRAEPDLETCHELLASFPKHLSLRYR